MRMSLMETFYLIPYFLAAGRLFLYKPARSKAFGSKASGANGNAKAS